MNADVAIVGGGPSGLATATWLARRGFRTLVLEKAAEPVEKACGEGLMPSGLRELSRLGLPALAGAPFRGIRYVQEDGRTVEATFAEGEGLGLPRLRLVSALREAAERAGAGIVRATAKALHRIPSGLRIESDTSEIEATLLVGADGLGSSVRKLAGLDLPPRGPERYGLRAHLPVAPWTDRVEVHWSAGAEAYVTPIGPAEINLAFLWDRSALGSATFETLLSRFPRLRERLGGAGARDRGAVRGAGPLSRRASALVAPHLALVGDAGGYVDAITGQGLSTAFAAARALAEVLPASLEGPALASALRRYERAARRRYAGYAIPARVLLLLAASPRLRRRVLGSLPKPAFAALLRAVV